MCVIHTVYSFYHFCDWWICAQKFKFDCHFFIISLFSSWLRSYIYLLFIHLTLWWWSWTNVGVAFSFAICKYYYYVSTSSSQWNGLLAVDVVRPQKSVALKNAAQLQLHRQCVGISTKKKRYNKIFNKNFGLATTFLTRKQQSKIAGGDSFHHK